MWSSRTIGLQNPRSLLRLVWWNDVTHLGIRAFKEQHDCQIEYFTVSEKYVEYKERQTKNHQGAETSFRKRARKSVLNQNMENRWRRERDLDQPFVTSRWQSSWNFFPHSSWRANNKCVVQGNSCGSKHTGKTDEDHCIYRFFGW